MRADNSIERLRQARHVIAVIAVCIVVTAGGVVWWRRAHPPIPPLTGAVLTEPAAAYNFRLHDHHGAPVSLAQFRGRPVALTFLYTHCPDVCPLVAEAMHRAYELLGPDAQRVAFVAVSVDPDGDTSQAIDGFLVAHRAVGQLRYLTGSFAELQPAWGHYYVGSDARHVNPAAVTNAPAAVQQIEHTAIVYVIDARGMIRVFLPGNLDPADLAQNLRVLLREVPDEQGHD
jgi:protein SCO1/2